MTDLPKPRKELFIWWTTAAEAICIGTKAPAALPDYVREQFHHRRGFKGGEGKLWVDEKFGPREVTEWPPTMIATMIKEGTSAGIVFVSTDLQSFKGVPGLVTDFKLRVVVV